MHKISKDIVNARCYKGINRKIMCGDLIFQVIDAEPSMNANKNDDHSQDFNQAVSQSYQQRHLFLANKYQTEAETRLKVNHVGIVISASMMIESTPKNGVSCTEIKVFLARSQYNIHARVKHTHIIDAAVLRATSYLGAPYNHTFQPDSTGYYCSELVTESFLWENEKKEIEPYFKRMPMNFKSAMTQAILPYWRTYYLRLNQTIPQNVLGSHPAQILEQHALFSQISVLSTPKIPQH